MKALLVVALLAFSVAGCTTWSSPISTSRGQAADAPSSVLSHGTVAPATGVRELPVKD